jgi:hypothetical protein
MSVGAATAGPLLVVLHGPDCAPLSRTDVVRLFRAGGLTPVRLDRLRTLARMQVTRDERVVAAATCEWRLDELRVPDIGICPSDACPDSVAGALLDGLESAALAGGSRRIVLGAPRDWTDRLERRGYCSISASGAVRWFEKITA